MKRKDRQDAGKPAPKSAGRIVRRLILAFSALGLLALCMTAALNAVVLNSTKDHILSEGEASLLEDVDCVLVLGGGVRRDGKPSAVLMDRVLAGIRVYESSVTDRLLMSGDHGRKNYDEVNTMKNIAVESGIPAGNVFCDHAGFSTYESMYRAGAIFGADKIIIVSQSSHLPRAVYDARRLGIEAYGVSADARVYGNGRFRAVREVLARVKDCIRYFFKPEPTCLGEKIPIPSDGSLTDG